MYDDLTYAIIGCLFKVYNTLGNIWREDAYEKAVALELRSKGFRAERQKEFEVFYFDRRVGSYRADLLVEDKIVVELKVAPQLVPLHKAQLISYLKGFDKPLGILANFGGPSLDHQTFPNKTHLKTPLRNDFDFADVRTEGKEEIKALLLMANRILVTLGAGYFHQIYSRAFYHELKSAELDFRPVRQIFAEYRDEKVDSRQVNFFVLGELLLSAVAVKEFNDDLLSKFQNYMRHFKLKRGLIFNFNALRLDFRYFVY